MCAESYCHNCGYYRLLADGWHCQWCLDFFRSNGRMPRPGDGRELSVIELLYARLDVARA